MSIYQFTCVAPVAVLFLVGAVACWLNGLQ